MIVLVILALTSELIILGPGVLSKADVDVLERVAERRILNNWGLEQIDINDYDVLLAPSDCGLLGRDGYLISNQQIFSALIVDCEARHHKGQMRQRGLLADVNRLELVHQKGYVIVR